jgi:hypothetical protein
MRLVARMPRNADIEDDIEEQEHKKDKDKGDSMASFQNQLAALNPVPPDNDMPPPPSTAAIDVIVNTSASASASANANISPSKQPKAIHAILEWGYANGRETGWRAKDLGVDRERISR